MSELYRRFILFLNLLLTASSLLNAQYQSEPDIIPTLPQGNFPVTNQNWEISQDPVTGYIYFANSTGLVQYNGLSSTTYTLQQQHGFRSVYVDSTGNIYTGSYEDFGLWKNDGNGGLVYSSMANDVNMPKNDEIWNIHQVRDTLFFQSFTTIYAASKGRVWAVKSPSIMLFMFRTGDNFIVQALGKGLYFFNGSDFSFIKGSEIFSSREVLAVLKTGNNTYWICTARDGIYEYGNQKFKELNTTLSSYLKTYSCNAGMILNDSVYVFGTILNGIIYANKSGEILKTYNYANGLNNNTVLSLFRDSENNIWAGLDEGVACIAGNSPYTLYTDRRGTLGTIYTVARKNNLIYFGTNHGLFAAETGQVNGEYYFNNLELIPNTQGQVWILYEFNNELYCGHNDGTFRVKDRSIEKISDITGGWAFTVYRGTLLQGNYTGIARFRDNISRKPEGSRIIGFGEPTRYIETDHRGYVWAIHPQKGIYRLELNENIDSVTSVVHFSGVQGRITVSTINNEVVFMNSRGIFSYDYANNVFYELKSLEKGLGEYIRSTQIIPYEKNMYWFITRNKIALFDVSRSFEAVKIMELVQKFTELPGIEQVIALDRQNILIPTRQAFTLFNASVPVGKLVKRNPAIVRITAGGKSGSRVIIPSDNLKITIPYKLNNITFFVANPSGFSNGNREISYRISSIDSSWHSAVRDNFSFLNMNYGTYTAEIRSSAGNGTGILVFTILRPWYLSKVAWLCYFVIAVLLFLAARKIFLMELKRQRTLIEYELRKQKLENELDYKSYELMLTMRYLIKKTEILKELRTQIDSLKEESSKYPVRYVRQMEKIINEGLNSQTEEWKSVMNNLKLSQEGFFKKLKDRFSGLTTNDLRLCSYLRMNFTTKEIAQLLNISARAVEIARYRLRSKMKLDHNVNLTEFLIAQAENEG